MSIAIEPTYFTITDNHGTRSGAGWDFSDLYDQSDIYVSDDEEQPEMMLEVFDSPQHRDRYVALANERLRTFGVPDEHLADLAALVALAAVHYSYNQYYMVQEVLAQYGVSEAVQESEEWQSFLLSGVEDIIYKQTKA